MKKIIQAASYCGYVEEGKWFCDTIAGTGACIISLIKKNMFKSYPLSRALQFCSIIHSGEARQNN